ncbi:hypothetical protein BC831DRAFT_448565 [Entophlyctis helioformis]|nr:hypothetical protein BC831DRAFT_448565 [Entophlyctis helioformis]
MDAQWAPPPGPPPGPNPRATSLGSLCALPDVIISEGILAGLSAQDLLTLSTASKLFFAFCRDDKLWRRLCLEKWGRSKSPTSGAPVSIVFKGSWRLTLLFPFTISDPAVDAQFRRAQAALQYTPSTMPGEVYSPHLYAKWYRSRLDLSQFVPEAGANVTVHGSLHRVKMSDLRGGEHFRIAYERHGIPLMIEPDENVLAWDAMRKWTVEYLAGKYSDVFFKVGNEYGNPRNINMSFGDYIHYMHHQQDDSPLYVFDEQFAHRAPDLADAYSTPSIFEQDYLSVLGESGRPDYRWLVIGPMRSGASWHIDPLGTSAWNTLIVGRKRWMLYPPQIMPPGGSLPLSTLSWYMDVYPHLPADMRPIEIVQNPGETIFVPAGWPHAVLNLDPVNIAVTQNWMGDGNARRCLQEIYGSRVKTYHALREHLVPVVPKMEPLFDEFEEHLKKRGVAVGDGVNAESDVMLVAACDDGNDAMSDHGHFDEHDQPREPVDAIWLGRIQTAFQASVDASLVVDPAHISQRITSGQNHVYYHHPLRSYIKFLTVTKSPAHERAHHEVSALTRVASSGDAELIDRTQVYVASGELDGDDGTRMPYIISRECGANYNDAMDLAATVDDHLSNRPFPVGNFGRLSWTHYVDWPAFVPWLADTVSRLHALPPPSPPSQSISSSSPSPSFTEIIRDRLASAPSRHRVWRYFPAAMLDTMADYIARNPVDDRVWCTGLVHGDVTPGNILGLMYPTGPASAADDAGDAGNTDDADDADVEFKWRPLYLIDFGDALSPANDGTDPLLDIVSIHLTLFRCDKTRLAEFLDAYDSRWRTRLGGASGAEGGRRGLANRLMVYALSWEYETMVREMTRWLFGGAAGVAGTWIPDGIAADDGVGMWEWLADTVFGLDL